MNEFEVFSLHSLLSVAPYERLEVYVLEQEIRKVIFGSKGGGERGRKEEGR